MCTDDLLLRLDFRDPEPEVIDLSPKGGVVSTLKEGKIECLSGDKVSVTLLVAHSANQAPFRMYICTISCFVTPESRLSSYHPSTASVV